jgi:uncharacterized repeat protein (TIGR01451 family)
VTRAIGTLAAGATDEQTLGYTIPCATTDGTTLTNTATASGTNALGNVEMTTSNNSGTASTLVQAPKLTLAKAATPSVGAGEAITYRLTYANTGTGRADSVVLTDTVPAGVYYHPALDLGAGPRPTTVTRNADGTTTLTWALAPIAGGSAPQEVAYTARPGLLALPGTPISSTASLAYTSAGGCTYNPVTASAATTIATVPITRNPVGHGYWKTHQETWTAETLARIQATDQRYDGIDGSLPSGQLSSFEMSSVLNGPGGQERVVRFHLLAAYFDLATRRIGPATRIRSATATRLGLPDVRAAVLYATATLALAQPTNKARYDDAIKVLDELVNNRSTVY